MTWLRSGVAVKGSMSSERSGRVDEVTLVEMVVLVLDVETGLKMQVELESGRTLLLLLLLLLLWLALKGG